MSGEDIRARFDDLSKRYMAESVRIWQRYAQVLGQLSGKQGREAGEPGNLADFAVKEGGEFMSNLMQLSLNYYSVLLDLSMGFANRMLDHVLAEPADGAPAAAPPPAAAESRTRFELQFRGQPGDRPSSAFRVENSQDRAAAVSFEITEFISEDGTTRFRVPVEFSPAEFTLEPGTEQVVECTVPLQPEFVPGRRYMALVRVTGFAGMEVGLIVTPEAAAE
jgi:hypothetical protein